MIDETAEKSSDLRWVREVLEREPAAVEEFVQLLGKVPAMVRSKHERLGAPLDATELEDVVQETVTGVWRKLGTFRGDSALSTWVFGFAVRELLKGVQKRARVRDRRVAWGQVEPERLATTGGVDALSALSEAELLHAALDEMDADLAEVLRAKHFELWTFERIAQELGIPLGTAKTRYYHAVDLLRAKLAPSFRRAQ